MRSSYLRGVFAPIPTFWCGRTGLGGLDHSSLHHNLHSLWFRDSQRPYFDGLCVLGSTGEFALMTEAEKMEVMREVVKVTRSISPNTKLMAGTGCPSTQLTINRCQAAADCGYESVMVVTPYYYLSRLNDDILFEHFSAIANASPIPVVLYSMPSFAGLEVRPALAARLASHPNIIGMKDSTGRPENIRQLIEATKGQDFGVLAGTAGVLASCLSSGAVGGIVGLANIMGQRLREIYTLAERGDTSNAIRLNDCLVHVNTLVTAKYSIPGMKYALELCGGRGGYVRQPFGPLTEDEKNEIRITMEKANRSWESAIATPSQ
jgi:4-hydroxy-2-oxoglutarate aldolase